MEQQPEPPEYFCIQFGVDSPTFLPPSRKMESFLKVPESLWLDEAIICAKNWKVILAWCEHSWS